jgi:hypothetical protein
MTEIQAPPASPPAAEPEFIASLHAVMEDIVRKLPDGATLGQLVQETRNNRHMCALLDHLSVQQLIDMAKRRPEAGASEANGRAEPEIVFDEEGNPIMALSDGPTVVRRRADVPDGDVRVLRCLADEGPLTEGAITRHARLTSEQVRLILRHLRSKGYIHVEGSGTKRRVKITRNGSGWLRRNG